MNDFAQFVLSKLHGSIVMILLAIPLMAVGILAAFLIFRKKQKAFPWKKSLLWTALFGYLLALTYITLLRGGGAAFRDVNLHLFRAWREAWNHYSVRGWLNVLLNVAMFVPLGILLPLVFPKMRRWYQTFGIGFAVSLVIELLQLWQGSGVADIDDLFANTLGTVIGYAAVILAIAIWPETKIGKKQIISCGLALMLSLGGIAGIFITYQLREYGNMPYTASFRVNTKDVTWTLDCSLPQTQRVMPTYQSKSLTKQDCDSFAEAFAEKFGIEYDTIQYYDEEAYYTDHGGEDGFHFLNVSYLGGGYDYCGNTWDVASWGIADEETIKAALAEYPVTIPEGAVFLVEDEGWHSFTANCIVIGDTMYDGTIKCRYGADGIIYEVENYLIAYHPSGEIAVLTPQEAYARLCAGHFSGGEYFAYKAPKQVRVVAMAMEYRIDTKGFYRPVYVFDLISADSAYRTTVSVVAD